MTLTRILRIEVRYLQFDDLRAMAYCEKRWQQEGSPATKWDMVNFIERMLQGLQHNGMGYPKVLLLRKKEIQRSTFTLEPLPETDDARGRQISNSDFCPECQGQGFLPVPGRATGLLCMGCMGKGRREINQKGFAQG